MPKSTLEPIGDVLRTDNKGYLVKTVSNRTFFKPLVPLIDKIVLVAQEVFNDQLHSVYIRGSVAKGKFIANISDLDSVFVVKSEPSEQLMKKLQQKLTDLNKLFPDVTTIERNVKTIDNILSSNNPIYKYQMVCVFGADITTELPELKPGKDSVVHLRKIIGRIDEFIANANEHTEPGWIKVWSIWICKLMIRSCHELLAEELQEFARDIYPCYIASAKKWPEYEPLFKRVAEIAVFGTKNKTELIKVIKEMKEFLLPKIEDFYR